MSVFGGGLTAAVALRQRVLEGLGAEEEWTEHGPGFIAWMSGPVATFFHVQPGEAGTPDLGVLRIVTPVATAADRSAACYGCDQLNRQGAISRWIFVRAGEGDEQALAAMCSFVVGPHNLDQLTAFAIWCAREQIAEATAAIADGIATRLGDGTLYGWGAYSGKGTRQHPHEVARQERNGPSRTAPFWQSTCAPRSWTCAARWPTRAPPSGDRGRTPRSLPARCR